MLSSSATCAATAPPLAYTADPGEGRARFAVRAGGLDVEKKVRRRMIHGDADDLERHN